MGILTVKKDAKMFEFIFTSGECILRKLRVARLLTLTQFSAFQINESIQNFTEERND